MRAHVSIVIMQGSPIEIFNPVTPSDPNFPVHTAHPVPWILSIPNLALILLSNPESQRSNEEKPASEKSVGDLMQWRFVTEGMLIVKFTY